MCAITCDFVFLLLHFCFSFFQSQLSQKLWNLSSWRWLGRGLRTKVFYLTELGWALLKHISKCILLKMHNLVILVKMMNLLFLSAPSVRCSANLELLSRWERIKLCNQFKVCGINFPIQLASYRLRSSTLLPPQNPISIKGKTNMTDDEGFIHFAKSKNLTSKAKNTPKFDTKKKFETLLNMSDDCAEMDNISNSLPPKTST